MISLTVQIKILNKRISSPLTSKSCFTQYYRKKLKHSCNLGICCSRDLVNYDENPLFQFLQIIGGKICRIHMVHESWTYASGNTHSDVFKGT